MLLKTSQNYLKHAPDHLKVCPYFKNQWHRETNILVPVVKAGLMSAEWTSQGPYGRVMSSSLPKEQQDSWALSLGISFYNLQSKLFFKYTRLTAFGGPQDPHVTFLSILAEKAR